MSSATESDQSGPLQGLELHLRYHRTRTALTVNAVSWPGGRRQVDARAFLFFDDLTRDPSRGLQGLVEDLAEAILAGKLQSEESLQKLRSSVRNVLDTP